MSPSKGNFADQEAADAFDNFMLLGAMYLMGAPPSWVNRVLNGGLTPLIKQARPWVAHRTCEDVLGADSFYNTNKGSWRAFFTSGHNGHARRDRESEGDKAAAVTAAGTLCRVTVV
jgi:hypothetical protein